MFLRGLLHIFFIKSLHCSDTQKVSAQSYDLNFAELEITVNPAGCTSHKFPYSFMPEGLQYHTLYSLYTYIEKPFLKSWRPESNSRLISNPMTSSC